MAGRIKRDPRFGVYRAFQLHVERPVGSGAGDSPCSRLVFIGNPVCIERPTRFRHDPGPGPISLPDSVPLIWSHICHNDVVVRTCCERSIARRRKNQMFGNGLRGSPIIWRFQSVHNAVWHPAQITIDRQFRHVAGESVHIDRHGSKRVSRCVRTGPERHCLFVFRFPDFSDSCPVGTYSSVGASRKVVEKSHSFSLSSCRRASP